MLHYLSQELDRLDAGPLRGCHHAMGAFEGRVFKVASDPQHGFSKHGRERINLVEGHGVEGDAHAGQYVRHRFLARRWSSLPNLRQLHLIPKKKFAKRKVARAIATRRGENHVVLKARFPILRKHRHIVLKAIRETQDRFQIRIRARAS